MFKSALSSSAGMLWLSIDLLFFNCLLEFLISSLLLFIHFCKVYNPPDLDSLRNFINFIYLHCSFLFCCCQFLCYFIVPLISGFWHRFQLLRSCLLGNLVNFAFFWTINCFVLLDCQILFFFSYGFSAVSLTFSLNNVHISSIYSFVFVL